MISKLNTIWTIGLCALIGIATVTVICVASETPESLAHSLSSWVSNLDKMERITNVPHRMDDSTAMYCKPTYNINPHEGVGEAAYCHVYVSLEGIEAMKSGQGKYPQGTVIVKSKLESETSGDAILYTVMRKMKKAYDADHEDWEYSILDGPSKRVLARGKLDSCIACHQAYATTDYVTRAYIK
ncbi:MAG: hypothetical protein FJ308_07975 [Planctomycetes bacterium]|nr:hypothetical protein [Planctomycetota bacterium]